MKNLTIFLFVFGICLLGHVSGAAFRIVNELQNKKTLWMKCYSKNNVLGPTIIPNGEQYVNHFSPHMFGKTRFMCTLKQGPRFTHGHQSFRAFKVDGFWDWRAREDGIYLKREWDKRPHEAFQDNGENLKKEQGLCMIGEVYGKKSTVTVKNEFEPKSKKILKVHCKSKNDDLGIRYLNVGDIMPFSFKTNFWGTTEFWCNIYKGPDFKSFRGFTAYKAKGLFVKDGSSYNWLAREDGIYFHKDSQPAYYMLYWKKLGE